MADDPPQPGTEVGLDENDGVPEPMEMFTMDHPTQPISGVSSSANQESESVGEEEDYDEPDYGSYDITPDGEQSSKEERDPVFAELTDAIMAAAKADILQHENLTSELSDTGYRPNDDDKNETHAEYNSMNSREIPKNGLSNTNMDSAVDYLKQNGRHPNHGETGSDTGSDKMGVTTPGKMAGGPGMFYQRAAASTVQIDKEISVEKLRAQFEMKKMIITPKEKDDGGGDELKPIYV